MGLASPRLATQRLLLKHLDASDAGALFAYRSDPSVSRYQTWHPGGVDEARVFIETYGQREECQVGDWCQLGVYLLSTRELIGDIGLHLLPPDGRQIELGFSISPAHQRRGYAAEGVRALIAHLFVEAGIHRIVASVDPRNDASIGLLEHLGLRREAHHHQSIRTPAGWEDELIYAMLGSEWRQGPRH